MRFVKEQHKIRLLCFENEGGRDRHGPLLPNSIRCVTVGFSGSGKTSAVIFLLLSPHGLKFCNLYIYSKSIGQVKYEYLKQVFDGLKGIGYYTFSSNEDVIDPDDAKPYSVFIFDDVALENQTKIRDFFSRGRHKEIDCIYISQSYAKVPKHLIRDNLNFLIIFPQDNLNLTHIYNDHVGTDMTIEEFKRICKVCWDQKFGFLVINKDNDIEKGRYKYLFDTIIVPDRH